MRLFARKALLPSGWQQEVCVEIAGDVITGLSRSSQADHSVDLLVPGLFDLHNHGGDGYDAGQRSLPDLRRYLDTMFACGITDMLMTLSTGDPAKLRDDLQFVREAMRLQQDGKLGGTRIQGVHMEGPFLSPKRPGAMVASQLLMPDIDRFQRLFGTSLDLIREVTLAPELPGAAALAAWLLNQNIRVQAGHTDASYEQACEAFAAGIDSVCHTFNASRGIHHREPGILTAALLDPSVFCETICDLNHLHPAIIRLIYQAKGPDRMLLVSDSTMPTHCPDGVYQAANHPVIVQNGVKRTPEGALSGGSCYLDQSVRNLAALQIPLGDVFNMASRTPAARMRLPRLGSIRIGQMAHLAGYNEDLSPALSVCAESQVAVS